MFGVRADDLGQVGYIPHHGLPQVQGKHVSAAEKTKGKWMDPLLSQCKKKKVKKKFSTPTILLRVFPPCAFVIQRSLLLGCRESCVWRFVVHLHVAVRCIICFRLPVRSTNVVIFSC